MATQDNKDDMIAEEYEEMGWTDADRQAVDDIAKEAQEPQADRCTIHNQPCSIPFGRIMVCVFCAKDMAGYLVY